MKRCNSKARKKKEVEGKTFKSNNYGDVLVQEYINSGKVKVKFLQTGYEDYSTMSQIKSGCMKDKSLPNKRLIGIADNTSPTQKIGIVDGKRKVIWNCPYYTKWSSMLDRCYSKKLQERYPTYKDCVVCTEWLTFSKFKSWMEKQDWKGKALDKDILGDGKIYSPANCVFILPRVNNFVCDGGKIRGNYKIGVHSYNNRLVSKCRDPFLDNYVELGKFSYKEEDTAHNLWRFYKTILVIRMYKEGIIDDKRVYEALICKYKPESGLPELWGFLKPTLVEQHLNIPSLIVALEEVGLRVLNEDLL